MNVIEYKNAFVFSLRPEESMHKKSIESYEVENGLKIVFGNPKSKYKDKNSIKLIEVIYDKEYFGNDFDEVANHFHHTDFRYCVVQASLNKKFPPIRDFFLSESPIFGKIMILLCEKEPLYDTLLNQLDKYNEDALDDYMLAKRDVLYVEDVLEDLKKKQEGEYSVCTYNSINYKTEHKKFKTEKEAEDYIANDIEAFSAEIEDSLPGKIIMNPESVISHVTTSDGEREFIKVWEKGWMREDSDIIDATTKILQAGFLDMSEEQIIRIFLSMISSLGFDVDELFAFVSEPDSPPQKDNVISFSPHKE